jgi:hypothetical protein
MLWFFYELVLIGYFFWNGARYCLMVKLSSFEPTTIELFNSSYCLSCKLMIQYYDKTVECALQHSIQYYNKTVKCALQRSIQYYNKTVQCALQHSICTETTVLFYYIHGCFLTMSLMVAKEEFYAKSY